MMIIDNKFEIGQTVYLKTDEHQHPRIVLRITIHNGGFIYYSLGCGSTDSMHEDIEISAEKDITILTEN